LDVESEGWEVDIKARERGSKRARQQGSEGTREQESEGASRAGVDFKAALLRGL